MHVLGLDIGTSAAKAVLVDNRQAIVAQASAPLTIHAPRPGWFEQDPEDWWRAVEALVARLKAAAPAAFAEVAAIGLSGQMHGAVLIDADSNPVRPAILWNDARAGAECAALSGAMPDLARIAGVIAMPGFTAPKLMWLGAHEPRSLARAAHIVLAKDFVRLKLTGEVATDPSDAAGTLLLDEAARVWSPALVEAAGVPMTLLPRLVESASTSGSLRPEVATAWGLPPSVVVAGGAGDIAAGAVGIGALAEGDAFVSLGTSAQVFRARDRYAPKPETLIHAFAHALPGRWFEMAALLNGAGCLDWVARLLGEEEPGALMARTEAAFRGASPVLFLPYLAGERTPLNDPDARGAFANLDHATGPTDLVQAVLDGVAFSLAEGVAAFGDFDAAVLPAIGGGAQSRFWLKIMASVLGRPLARLAAAEAGPAFGAARLARMALTGEAIDAVCMKPAIAETIAPDVSLQEAYAARLPRFRALYQGLRRVRAPMADRPPAATR